MRQKCKLKRKNNGTLCYAKKGRKIESALSKWTHEKEPQTRLGQARGGRVLLGWGATPKIAKNRPPNRGRVPVFCAKKNPKNSNRLTGQRSVNTGVGDRSKLAFCFKISVHFGTGTRPMKTSKSTSTPGSVLFSKKGHENRRLLSWCFTCFT